MTRKKATNLPQLQRSNIGFDAIVGHKQTKKRLKAIIRIIQHPETLKHFEITAPKGLLIYGPESVGKHMLAKAFAKESGLPYLEISGSRLFEISYIKEVYETAAKHAPSVVILENLDIKGLLQGTFTNVSFSDIAKVMESVDAMVFTVATASSLEEIDPVLTAPQKLDFLLEVSRLDKDARRFFIERILQKPHDPKINVERIVRYITGMSALDLERLGRMAALNAVEQNEEVITEEILIEQINIIKYGHKIESQMIRNPEEELEMTAYHEAAHAVISMILLPHIKIEQVTVAPRSKTLGFVSYNAEDQISNVTKEELFNDVCVALAGRIARIKRAGDDQMDSGAVDDLARASFQIYAAITNLGMDSELGFINIDPIAALDSSFLSRQAEKRFLHWLDVAREHTARLVEEHWTKVEALARRLIEREIVESDELADIIGEKHGRVRIPHTL